MSRFGDTRGDTWGPQNSAGKAPGPLAGGGRGNALSPPPSSRTGRPSPPLPSVSRLTAEGQTQPPQFQAAAAATSSRCADAVATVRTRESAAITSLPASPNCRLPEQREVASPPFKHFELLAPPLPVAVKLPRPTASPSANSLKRFLSRVLPPE